MWTWPAREGEHGNAHKGEWDFFVHGGAPVGVDRTYQQLDDSSKPRSQLSHFATVV
jgi:hypothetical protein